MVRRPRRGRVCVGAARTHFKDMSTLTVLALATTHAGALRARPACTGRLLRSRRLYASVARGVSPVQKIYELASAGNLRGTMELMDLLTAADVGMEDYPPLPPGSPVGYHHVYKDRELSMGIFVIPAGRGIPLHDHPHMTVLSKLLFGSLRVTSYDRPEGTSPPGLQELFGRAQKAPPLRVGAPEVAEVSAPCATLRLDPIRRNIHQFEALRDTAIFDVLAPPYDDFAGRSCHYYEVDQARSELREVGWPPGLEVVSRAYEGPRCGPA